MPHARFAQDAKTPRQEIRDFPLCVFAPLREPFPPSIDTPCFIALALRALAASCELHTGPVEPRAKSRSREGEAWTDAFA